ncbi:hypothetical protein [Streptomyces sp. AC512_CC834]|uniref:hypothetical protein n=1 Tax=Streptomyces sp. AC512_CC834 TaxID=2823691 RepID=UPI0035AE176B
MGHRPESSVHPCEAELKFLLGGVPLFVSASAGATFATNPELLIACRALRAWPVRPFCPRRWPY